MRIRGRGVTQLRSRQGQPGQQPQPAPAGRRLPTLDWAQRTPWVYVSGCRWDCTGGAQRPVALTRALQGLGQPMIYANAEESFRLVDGVVVCSLADLEAMLPDLKRLRGGVAIAGLPSLWHYPSALGDEWRKVYDYFDDWEYYCRSNPGLYNPEEQQQAVTEADVVVASAWQLKVNAECDGADPERVHLIRNAGPENLTPTARRPGKGNVPKAVFCGSLWGSWVDWDCMCLLAQRLEAACCELHIIGGWGWNGSPHSGIPTGKNVVWHGPLPYANAMDLCGLCNVGIVPFRDPGICRSVDALKPYDYRASLCWTVGTDILPELQGTPWTTTAPAGEAFCQAVLDSLYLPMPRGQVSSYCRRNSWQARAQSLLEVFR